VSSYEEATITPVPRKEPNPTMPGLQQRIGDLPKERETTASKKVDDISKHESKHSFDPKRDPKHNAQEKVTDVPKVGPGQPQGDKPGLGSTKK
jgi:hypothetical protein